MGWEANRYHDISCGHRVYNQGSKCEQLHGHNYRVHFDCAASPGAVALDDVGRVIDFSDMKRLLCMWVENHWDHKTLIWTGDPWLRTLQDLDPSVVAVPFNPTAENMAQYLVEVVGPQQLRGTGIDLVRVRIDETRKCSATFTREGSTNV
jgi:6-pyruvoyltetrahydropterin/6-carboxytetrahydropterin synthase